MLGIMFKVWVGAFVLYLFGHFLFIDYVKQATVASLQSGGYHYLKVNRASLPYDALLRTEANGSLSTTMDGREVALNLHIDGNPIWSRQVIVSVAMPNMAALRFTLGAQ